MQAMDRAGKSTGRIWIGAGMAPDSADVFFTVRDEGPGVAKGMEQEIFQPFVTTRPDGIGMGLAISRSLVEMQGGRLWYETGEGPGAVFRFTLPCAR